MRGALHKPHIATHDSSAVHRGQRAGHAEPAGGGDGAGLDGRPLRLHLDHLADDLAGDPRGAQARRRPGLLDRRGDGAARAAQHLRRHQALGRAALPHGARAATGLPIIILRTSRFFPEEDDMAHEIIQSGANTKANEFLFRRLTVEDAAAAHVVALDRAPQIGFDTFIISALTPFSPEDCEQLMEMRRSSCDRYFPRYREIYARRGWTMFDYIDRVYDSQARRCAAWASSARPTSATSSPSSTARMGSHLCSQAVARRGRRPSGQRVVLRRHAAVCIVAGKAIEAMRVILGLCWPSARWCWCSSCRLARRAADSSDWPIPICRRSGASCPSRCRAGAGRGADRSGRRAQPLSRISPRCRGRAVAGRQGEVPAGERQPRRQDYDEPTRDARRPDHARRAGRARSIATSPAIARAIRCCAPTTCSARREIWSCRSASMSRARCSSRITRASRPGASTRATSTRPTASSHRCAAIRRR